MKKLLLIFILLFTLTACKQVELMKFFNKLNNPNSTYLLIITVNDTDRNVLYVNNNNAYAYTSLEDGKTNEMYFTNISGDYKTYTYQNDQWKTTSIKSYYNDYFGLVMLKDQKFKNGTDNYCYTLDYEIATFEIDLTKSTVLLTNNETKEYVFYKYDFGIAPEVVLPF
ncbi:MAG: hypothetical protein R3Y05_05610 [bacterium]